MLLDVTRLTLRLERMVLDVLSLALLCQPDIELRRIQGSVPKELLDSHQIRSHLNVMRCKRVPEGVDPCALDVGGGKVLAYKILILSGRHRPVSTGDKQGICIYIRPQLEPGTQRFTRLGVEKNRPSPPPLSQDPQGAKCVVANTLWEIEVGEGQASDLGQANPRLQEQLHNRSIPGFLDHRQDSLVFLFRENPRLILLSLRRDDSRGRIGGDQVVGLEPLEERSDDGQLPPP